MSLTAEFTNDFPHGIGASTTGHSSLSTQQFNIYSVQKHMKRYIEHNCLGFRHLSDTDQHNTLFINQQ
jgi:hypothetical protein